MELVDKTKFKDVLGGLALVTLGISGALAMKPAMNAKADPYWAPTYHFKPSGFNAGDHAWGSYPGGRKVMPGTFVAGSSGYQAFCRDYWRYTPTHRSQKGGPVNVAGLHVLEAGIPGHTAKELGHSYEVCEVATQMAFWQVEGTGNNTFRVSKAGMYSARGREAQKLALQILHTASTYKSSNQAPQPVFKAIANYPKDHFQTYQGYQLEGLHGVALKKDQSTMDVSGLPNGAYVTISGHKIGNGNGHFHVSIQDGQRIGIHIPQSDAKAGNHYKWNVSLNGSAPFVWARNYYPTSAAYDEQDSTVLKLYHMKPVQIGNNYQKKNQPVPKFGSLEVTKKDTSGQLMPGTKISLYQQGTDGEYHFVDAEQTNNAGQAIFSHLKGGAYLVREDNTDAEHKITDPSGKVVQAFVNVQANNGAPSQVTLTDQKIADMPHMKSFVAENGTEHRNLDAKAQTLHDELDIYHLDAGHQYYVTDTLMDADTGAPAKINGKTYGGSEQFTAGSSDPDKNNGGNPQQGGNAGDKVNHQVPINTGSIPFNNMQNHRYYMQADIKANNSSGQVLYMERSDIDANQNIHIKNPWATSNLINKTSEHYNDGSAEDQNKSYLRDANPDLNIVQYT